MAGPRAQQGGSQGAVSGTLTGRGLAAIALAAALGPLNSTMIVVALPDLTRDLSVGLGAAAWLVTGYLAAMALLQPLAGRLGDRFGRARAMRAGIAGFGVLSVACALAPSLAVLIPVRILQGAAGAVAMSNGIAIVREGSAAGGLGRRLGLVQATVPLAAMIGPAVAGGLVAIGGWQAIFWANLPLVAAATVVAAAGLPGAPRTPRPGASAPRRVGIATALFPAGLLRLPGFASAAGAMVLSNVALHAVLVAVPVVLAHKLGWSSGAVGGTLAVFALASVIAAPPAGRLADHHGRVLPAAIGLWLLGLALLGVAIDETSPPLSLVGSLFLAGAGIGLSTPALQAAALEAVPVTSAGVASGGFASARYVGAIAGAALAAGPLGPGSDGTGDLTALFALLAVLVVVGSVLSLRLAPVDPLTSEV